MYLNAIYQGLLEPQPVHAIGGGVSVAGNIGGAGSGVDSWGRVGLDVLVIPTYTVRSDTWDVEARITPNVQARVLNNAIAAFGLGPSHHRFEPRQARPAGYADGRVRRRCSDRPAADAPCCNVRFDEVDLRAGDDHG